MISNDASFGRVRPETWTTSIIIMSLEPYLKVLFQVSVSAEEKRAAGIVLAAAASAAACGVC